MNTHQQASFLDLLRKFVQEFTTLAKLDLLLLQAETKEKAGTLVKAIVSAIFGLVIVFYAISYFLVTIDRALILAGLAPWLSALVIGVGLLAVSGALVGMAVARLKTWTPVPKRTIAQVNTNLAALKTSMDHGSPQPAVPR
jgi:hypothetical protein